MYLQWFDPTGKSPRSIHYTFKANEWMYLDLEFVHSYNPRSATPRREGAPALYVVGERQEHVGEVVRRPARSILNWCSSSGPWQPEGSCCARGEPGWVLQDVQPQRDQISLGQQGRHHGVRRRRVHGRLPGPENDMCTVVAVETLIKNINLVAGRLRRSSRLSCDRQERQEDCRLLVRHRQLGHRVRH